MMFGTDIKSDLKRGQLIIKGKKHKWVWGEKIPNKQQLRELKILEKMVLHEIKEWQKFLKLLEKKRKELK